MEEEEAVEEEEEEQEQEKRLPASGVCAVCGGCWDEGGSALFPYYRCRKCALPVHAACRPFANAALACPPQAPHQGLTLTLARRPSLPDARQVNRHGVVTVRVKQAYDLPCGPGERVYVVARLLPWPERVRTGKAAVGRGGEALWARSASDAATTSSSSSSSSAGDPSGEGVSLSLLHPYNSAATPAPTLRLELWSSPSSVTSLLDKCLGAAGKCQF